MRELKHFQAVSIWGEVADSGSQVAPQRRLHTFGGEAVAGAAVAVQPQPTANWQRPRVS